MRKILCAVLALILALSCVSAFAEEPFLAGGWSMTEDTAVTDEARAALEKALEEYVGANYEPIALLGTQVVAGLNYCILCRAATVTLDPVSFYALVYVYAGLDGSAELLDVETLRMGVNPLDEEPESEWQNPAVNIAGVYSDTTSQRAFMIIEPLGECYAGVTITWANSANETVEWSFNGMVDENTLDITYIEGEKRIFTYDEEGNETNVLVYEDGTGTLKVAEDDTIRWVDEKENAGAECVFVWDEIIE